MDQNPEQTKWSQFLSLIIVFFFWGFVAASNDILIPVFKKWFVLSQLQSQLVANAFYMAYFIGSIIFYIISVKGDILQKFGYKKTLAGGLCISALGAFLFIPAAASANFWFFLLALFVVALGFSVQQIVANPLAIKMGSASTGAHRLTLAGGINSLGTTIGPILVGLALFGPSEKKETPTGKETKIELLTSTYQAQKDELNKNLLELAKDNNDDATEVQKTITSVTAEVAKLDTQLSVMATKPNATEEEVDVFAKELDDIKKSAASITYPQNFVKEHLNLVKLPFIVLGLAFIAVAIFLLFSKIEDPSKDTETVETNLDKEEKFSITKYPQLMFGMLAIFVYVGVEVSIISNLPALLHTREFGSILESDIAPFVSLYWGSLMIGRWNGGINVFNTSKITNLILKFIVPFIAFAVIIVANEMSGKNVSSFYIYGAWILLFVIMSFLGGKNAGRSLMIFGVAGIIMMLCGLFYPDKTVAMYFFISGGLFCSIMWSSIFDLAIAGLGKNTGKASSFLIMMILGGGIIPLIQGWICDFDLNSKTGIMGMTYTHFSYIIPVLCFLYLAIYGYLTPRYLKSKGIVLNEDEK